MENLKFSRLRFYSSVLLCTILFTPLLLIVVLGWHGEYNDRIKDSAITTASIDQVLETRRKKSGTSITVYYSFAVGSHAFHGSGEIIDREEWRSRKNKSTVQIYYLKSDPKWNGFVDDWNNRAEERPIELELMFASILAMLPALFFTGFCHFVLGFFPRIKNPFMVKA